MTEEEQKQLIQHLLIMLKTIYREQIAYQALVEYLKLNRDERRLDEILDECRADPACQIQTDAYFHDYDELIRLSDELRGADLRQALLRELLARWKPEGWLN